MTPDVETRPVGPDDVADLASLFGSQRSTRRCWCMAFCVSGRRFAIGWLNGGNRRAFEALDQSSATPMGLLASVAVELARREGASAIETWPSTQPGPADAFLGREELFADQGFECVARPAPGRVIMRLEISVS